MRPMARLGRSDSEEKNSPTWPDSPPGQVCEEQLYFGVCRLGAFLLLTLEVLVNKPARGQGTERQTEGGRAVIRMFMFTPVCHSTLHAARIEHDAASSHVADGDFGRRKDALGDVEGDCAGGGVAGGCSCCRRKSK